MPALLRLWRHRRFTANHTWHLDLAGRALFAKLNPNRAEAAAEVAGHAALAEHYPVPRLVGHRRVPRGTLLLFERLPHLDVDQGLLLDVLAHADATGDTTSLALAATAITDHLRHMLVTTAALDCACAVVGKLYRDRAVPGGRLDTYHHNQMWLTRPDVRPLRTADLAGTTLVVNGRPTTLDFTAITAWLRDELTGHGTVWTAVGQGDPTLFNLTWHAATGPVWLDYDTGGRVAIPGELAVLLADLWIHSRWLTPALNPAAYRDHPKALAGYQPPQASIRARGTVVEIDTNHRPAGARASLLRHWLDDLVLPVAAHLGVDDPTRWLRPYLAMRLLTVYRPADLPTAHAALLLAALTDVLTPALDLHSLLGLTRPTTNSATTSQKGPRP